MHPEVDLPPPKERMQLWKAELREIRATCQEEIGDRSGYFADPLKEKQMRLAVAATHCLETVDVRILFDEAIRTAYVAGNRGELSLASERMRIAKMAAETLSIIQQMERKSYRLEDTPIPMTSGDVQSVGQVVFTVQQARVQENQDAAYETEDT
jgi:hypothetical protein